MCDASPGVPGSWFSPENYEDDNEGRDFHTFQIVIYKKKFIFYLDLEHN